MKNRKMLEEQLERAENYYKNNTDREDVRNKIIELKNILQGMDREILLETQKKELKKLDTEISDYDREIRQLKRDIRRETQFRRNGYNYGEFQEHMEIIHNLIPIEISYMELNRVIDERNEVVAEYNKLYMEVNK